MENGHGENNQTLNLNPHRLRHYLVGAGGDWRGEVKKSNKTRPVQIMSAMANNLQKQDYILFERLDKFVDSLELKTSNVAVIRVALDKFLKGKGF